MKLSHELTWRGFVNQSTMSDLTALDRGKLTFYHGYDAASDSLTIGNLAALMMDKCFLRHGHKAIFLTGGATSLIGDPGGKDSERSLQAADVIKSNIEKITVQIKRLFGSDALIINNLDWFQEIKLLDFLRDIGKHFSMTPLVQRDYIAKRMGEHGSGISYAEFSYTILQGYDFLKLFEDHNVTLQLAGSDQWGNGISGVELVRRVKSAEVHVLSCPLIVNKSTGQKFGKTEAGAIWLDPNKTSVFKFYQYWLNVDDESALDYLKIFTELDKTAIEKLITSFKQNPAGRLAQKTLAHEVTKLVHGSDQTAKVEQVTEVLFGEQDFFKLSEPEIKILRSELTNIKLQKDSAQTLIKAQLATSISDAQRLITEGAISVNGMKLEINQDPEWRSGSNLVKRGKNNFAIVQRD
ncbi:MAG TPA: tyrosine--tRNA ligase [Candidatus Saccharimonadales bacterium]|nr:tyrosine--tRNA ligase [Candidatus Saccharimonadales bacterium]